jgi:hypothetical protein
MNYTFGWKLKDEGWKEAKQEYYSQMHLDKKNYTINYLSPAIREGNTGWNNVEYKIMIKIVKVGVTEEEKIFLREFLVVWESKIGTSGSRWIDVSGNSKMAKLTSLADNIN